MNVHIKCQKLFFEWMEIIMCKMFMCLAYYALCDVFNYFSYSIVHLSWNHFCDFSIGNTIIYYTIIEKI